RNRDGTTRLLNEAKNEDGGKRNITESLHRENYSIEAFQEIDGPIRKVLEYCFPFASLQWKNGAKEWIAERKGEGLHYKTRSEFHSPSIHVRNNEFVFAPLFPSIGVYGRSQ
ncbi:hypothetical protein NPIL_241421, partial [Nephila pilipes]